MRHIQISLLAFFIFVSGNLYAQPQFRAFLFTKTDGWHHESINEGVDALRALGERHQFYVEWNEMANRVNDEYLSNFDVIIFLSTTQNILNEEQQGAMERFIQSGKGFVGIHAASDTEYEWEWYTQLVGRMFVHHPANQTTRVTVIDRNFPGLERVPDSFLWTDEWYAFGEEKIEGLNYLLTIDESMYDIQPPWIDDPVEGMGDFHPVAWYHEFDGGRSYYNAMGHMPQTFSDAMFMEMLYGGIYWAATGKGMK